MKNNVTKEQQKIEFNEPLVTDAAEQFLGYSVQVTCMTERLLNATAGQVVSLEHYGDISVQINGIVVETKENKNTVTDTNPFSDRSVGLWKSIANWVRGVATGVYSPENTKFILSTSARSRSKLVKLFSSVKTIDEARKAIVEARELLWGKPPKYSKRKSVADTIKIHLDEIFNANEEVVAKIILNLELQQEIVNPIANLRLSVSNKMIRNNIVDNVMIHMLGWVKLQVDQDIKNGKSASIEYDSFAKEFATYVWKKSNVSALTALSTKPSNKIIEDENQAMHIYLCQLDLIECNDDDRIEAIIDYLRAKTDRIGWAERGDIHETSFNELEQSLIRYWNNKQKSFNILYKTKTEVDRGQLLYRDCISRKFTLEGLEVPDHFCPGSYHSLSDVKRLGWHPDFEKKLS